MGASCLLTGGFGWVLGASMWASRLKRHQTGVVALVFFFTGNFARNSF